MKELTCKMKNLGNFEDGSFPLRGVTLLTGDIDLDLITDLIYLGDNKVTGKGYSLECPRKIPIGQAGSSAEFDVDGHTVVVTESVFTGRPARYYTMSENENLFGNRIHCHTVDEVFGETVFTQPKTPKSGDVLFYRQPELNFQKERIGDVSYLYPKKQLRVVDRFLGLLKENIRLIITSNSDYVLFSLRIAVRKGRIAPEDVSVVFFQEDHGVISYIDLKIDKNGTLSDYPKGMCDCFEECLIELF